MSEINPCFSIVVRTKDRPELLKRALKSISFQLYRNLQVVLVNDGGCDLDLQDIKGVLGNIPLHYIRLEKNTGRAHAGNIGIENANGAYIGFLDDDDEFYPEHVFELISVLRGGDYKVGYTDSEIVNREYDFCNGGYTETARKLFMSRDFSRNDLLVENYIPLINIAIERNTLRSLGMFDESLRAYEDWDMLIRVASRHVFKHVRRVTAQYIQWSSEHQIAQGREHGEILEEEYYKVIKKHISLITPDVIKHIRDSMNDMRERIKTLEAHVFHNKVSADTTPLTCSEGIMRSETEGHLGGMHASRRWKALTLYCRVKDRCLGIIRGIVVKPL